MIATKIKLTTRAHESNDLVLLNVDSDSFQNLHIFLGRVVKLDALQRNLALNILISLVRQFTIGSFDLRLIF